MELGAEQSRNAEKGLPALVAADGPNEPQSRAGDDPNEPRRGIGRCADRARAVAGGQVDAPGVDGGRHAELGDNQNEQRERSEARRPRPSAHRHQNDRHDGGHRESPASNQYRCSCPSPATTSVAAATATSSRTRGAGTCAGSTQASRRSERARSGPHAKRGSGAVANQITSVTRDGTSTARAVLLPGRSSQRGTRRGPVARPRSSKAIGRLTSRLAFPALIQPESQCHEPSTTFGGTPGRVPRQVHAILMTRRAAGRRQSTGSPPAVTEERIAGEHGLPREPADASSAGSSPRPRSHAMAVSARRGRRAAERIARPEPVERPESPLSSRKRTERRQPGGARSRPRRTRRVQRPDEDEQERREVEVRAADALRRPVSGR